MKKYVIALLSVLVIASTATTAYAAKYSKSPALAQAIKLYKSGDYTQAYRSLVTIAEKDKSNALAYYYLGMSAVQVGKKEEALTSYDKVISLSPNGVLGSYAKRGKKCVETPLKCHEVEDTTGDSPDDRFIKGAFGSGLSEEVRGMYEEQKLQNLMRQINRNSDITPESFKGYKDFSSQAEPTNDDIVAAIKILQRAGLTDVLSNKNDLSTLLGNRSTNYGNEYDMLNLMLGSGNNTAKLSPQVIQSILSSQMTANF